MRSVTSGSSEKPAPGSAMQRGLWLRVEGGVRMLREEKPTSVLEGKAYSTRDDPAAPCRGE